MAIVAMNPRSLWTPLLWGWGSFVSCTVCTFTPNCEWQQPYSSTRQAVYRDPQSLGMSLLDLAEAEERPSEKCLQFELQLWTCVSNVDTNMDPNTYSTTQATATFPATINTSSSFVERKSTLPQRSVSDFDIYRDTPLHTHAHTWLLDHRPPYNRLWADVFKKKCRSTLPIGLSSGSQHRHRGVSPISTLTAQPMIGTERLPMGINDVPAAITIQQDCVSHSEQR